MIYVYNLTGPYNGFNCFIVLGGSMDHALHERGSFRHLQNNGIDMGQQEYTTSFHSDLAPLVKKLSQVGCAFCPVLKPWFIEPCQKKLC